LLLPAIARLELDSKLDNKKKWTPTPSRNSNNKISCCNNNYKYCNKRCKLCRHSKLPQHNSRRLRHHQRNSLSNQRKPIKPAYSTMPIETISRFIRMEARRYNGALLTRRYGEITKEDVRNAAMLYHAARGRDAQNASILFNFLSASITDTILAKVNTEPERYVLQVPVPNQINQFVTVNDGTCLLKAIIDHTYTNTLSCATAAREALSSLDTYMAKLPKSDIEKMNQYVREKVNELAAANQTTSDLVMA